MKRLALLGCALLAGLAGRAQSVTDPHITTWLTSRSAQYARVYETTSDKSSGNAVSTWPRSGLTNSGGGQATAAYADVQRVAYSANYVYVYTTGLASYTMGNWLSPSGSVFMFWPTNRAAIHRIPRNASIPTTKQKANGVGGVWVNGVYLWENGDAQSYTTSTGQVSFNGQGIWNRLAGVAEAFNFDPANGHQPSSGAYHTHINPIGLRYQLGDNVTYNASTKTYSEASPTRHSPILGWALDGLPVYGPYGYSSPMDPTSGIRRMTSGFQKRDGTNGSTNLASTGRTTLPTWSASVQGKSATLASTEYGPNVNTTYPLGTFAEDYDYLGDLGKTQGVDFDLNRQNVRYCVTPEYPNGTYAYFVSIDASGTTAFPDVINQEFFGSTTGGQGTVTSINESVTDYQLGGPAATITVTATASGSGAALSWNSAEGATYKVESSADNTSWTTLSSAVTSGGLSTTFSAATAAVYYRVTLTAIATYDTGGTYGTAVGKSGTVQFGTPTVAPSITTQPASVTVTVGAAASFSVTASGTAPLSYQWQKSGTTISGATSATYSIAAAQSTDAGPYACVVSNSAGTVTSSTVTLTVNPATSAPTISTQPVSATVAQGAAATISVTASGTAPLSYQWYKGVSAISGATSAVLSFPTAQLADAGSYTVVVTNAAGSITSNAATLTVTTPVAAPAITTQPSNASVSVGGSASFAVAATGTGPLGYQWQKGGVAVPGATMATYTLANVQTSDAGSFACVVSNSAGSVTSNAASLTVSAAAVAPTIASQPAAVSAANGTSVTFAVVANGTAPLTYQWSKNGTALTGATAATLALAAVQASDAGTYVCTVTNSVGSVATNAAALTVSAASVAPTLSQQPADQAVAVGSSASFVVVANGTAPLAYQWYKGVTPLAGATSSTFRIAAVSAADAGSYACVVSNQVGSVTSTAATLTVNAASSGGSTAGSGGSSGSSTSTGTTTGSSTSTGTTSGTGTTAGTGSSAGSSSTSGTGTSSGTGSTGGTTSGVTGPLPARLINLSVRTQAGGAAGTPVTGFVVSGSGTGKRLIVRAIGPTLGSFGVTGALSDPQLQLWSGSAVVASNDNWQSSDAAAFTAVGAFPLTAGSADAALVANLPAGAYTTPVSAGGGSSGVVLIEAYDGSSTDTTTRLVNASARALVGTGDKVLIPGFVISGDGNVHLLIRAVGPQLFAYGVKDALLDPQLTVYQGTTAVATNDNWSDGANAAQLEATAATAGAFPLPTGSKDAAVLVTLPAGAYSAVVSGVAATTGTALVEIYVVP